MIPIIWYLGCALVLIVIGLYCLVVKKNMIRLLMGLEIILNAVNINLLVFSTYGPPDLIQPVGHVFVIVAIGIGGCILAVGLALVLNAYRHFRTLNVRKLRRIRW